MVKKTKKTTKSNPKQGANAEDLRNLEYILKSANPLPALFVSILKLVVPIIARIAVRQAISYAMKRKLIKSVSTSDRDSMAEKGASALQTIIEAILKKIAVS